MNFLVEEIQSKERNVCRQCIERYEQSIWAGSSCSLLFHPNIKVIVVNNKRVVLVTKNKRKKSRFGKKKTLILALDTASYLINFKSTFRE